MSDSPTPVTRRTFLRRGGAGAVLLTGGVLAGGTAAAAPARVPAAPAPADLDPLALLKKMLAFDTQNFGEGGVTRPHAEMLKAVWDSANVPAEIIPTPKKDNVHLIARIKGTTAAPPLLLLGHSDVVPVERDKWSVDPFAGVVKDGEIYGRGALDMKGANSANIAAVLRHVNEGAKFDRDIIVLTDCDEEAGQYGSAWLAQNHWDKINAGMVLTEGGWFLAQKDRRTPMLITVTRQDKVYFNLDLVADGIATHSSKPNPESAIARLSRAVTDIDTWLAPVALTPVTREYFGALAKATDDGPFERALRLLLAARSQPARERAAALVVKRSSYPWLHQALLRTTHSFVIEDAGYKENVIPSSATLRINCRGVPGGQRPRDFLAAFRKRLADRDVTVKLAGNPGESEEDALKRLDETWARQPSSLDSPLYTAIGEAAAETYPGAVFAPALFEAGTSLGPWTSKGVPGYGVYPYVLDNDQLIAMHGNDERITVEALKQGTEFMYRLFDRFRVR
ncbi:MULTISPECIES: M20/M25/M40 family metallo-hydrolase [Actinomadura]|uniref:Acetylornithine deacetylase/Succinyl-diaminopimelate desuccinylase n=1 Tax=Actinomadura madurae TaxID=1993 RepID=A0A1I4WNB7_9ACTN|nr:M20/M25/M40 family metallo-hydrolase [Actinomadura madurae]URN00160.1 M20/M25/M40 family metallo-hydrolase [Actinomadura madurae]URN02319.1 M20/M25/M40 family metallo-hydrolase [Actinomadura madurae]SFN15364.1 Acetylornithine deacetylase/Succinyl-diaminopimelate desuccinylase [Actinomadura madurae]SPT63030.1 Succinyl-diaminopimelate desuccinylase [Actinomadura madurae]